MSQADDLERMAAPEIPEVDLPEIPWTPLPDKLVKAFSDLETWQTDQQTAMEEWREQANYILRHASI